MKLSIQPDLDPELLKHFDWYKMMNVVPARFDAGLLASHIDAELHWIRGGLASVSEPDADWIAHNNAEQARAVKRVINLLSSAMEAMGLSGLMTRFLNEIIEFRNDPTELGLYGPNDYRAPLDGVFFDIIGDYTTVVCNLNGGLPKAYKNEQRTILKNMLDKTSATLSLLGVVPSSETQISKSVFPFFKVAFPDARSDRQVSFVKAGKTYHPDMSFPELRTCVEYKMAVTRAEFENALKAICEDINNYGDSSYDRFIAVIYVADQCTATQTDFSDRMKAMSSGMSNAGAWNFMLVAGPGQRKASRPDVARPVSSTREPTPDGVGSRPAEGGEK